MSCDDFGKMLDALRRALVGDLTRSAAAGEFSREEEKWVVFVGAFLCPGGVEVAFGK